MIDLSICIVNWCTGSLLQQCVESILATTDEIQYEIIVVDNNSDDESFTGVKELAKHDSRIHAIMLSKNVGFAAGNNIAISKSKGKYIVLLNPDTIVNTGSMKGAVAFLDEHQDCGVMGPRLLNLDGSIQPSVGNFPTPTGLFWETTKLRKVFPQVRAFSSFKRFDLNYQKMQVVDQPSGACFFVRRQVIDEVGLLDERYFMYYEEVDWCFRIKSAGWKIYYNPEISVVHLGGQSSKNNLDVRIVENVRSKLRFFKKYYGDRSLETYIVRLLAIFEAIIRGMILFVRAIIWEQDRREARKMLPRYKKVLQVCIINQGN